MVPDDPVVSAKVPCRNSAQLHGQLFDQSLNPIALKAYPVSGVSGQLLVRPNARQNHLPGNI